MWRPKLINPLLRAQEDKPQTSFKPGHALIYLIVLASLLRLTLAGSLGLGIDEAYTVSTSRIFDWSYFDHPPLAWWLTGAIAKLLGSETALVVRLPFIGLSAFASVLIYLLTARLFDAKSGFYAALLFTLAPALGVSDGTFVLPDGPLLVALLAGALCLLTLPESQPGSSGLFWLAGGICAGLALLAKYHGIFLLLGAGLFVITSARHRFWLASPWPYMGACLALLIFLPVLIWNAQHDWVSFQFQGGRALSSRFRPWMMLVAMGGQALFLTPWIWAPLMASTLKALRKGTEDSRSWFLLCLASGPILAFNILPLINGTPGLFHWSMPGYLLLLPLLGQALARRMEQAHRATQIWLRFTLALTPILLSAVIALALLPWPGLPWSKPDQSDDPLIETLEWSNLRNALKSADAPDRSTSFIAGERWHEAGRIDYAWRNEWRVTCLCEDARAYSVQAPLKDFVGQKAVLIIPQSRAENVNERFGASFTSLTLWKTLSVDHAGRPAFYLNLYIGEGFKKAALNG